jgi:hypothetical protein
MKFPVVALVVALASFAAAAPVPEAGPEAAPVSLFRPDAFVPSFSLQRLAGTPGMAKRQLEKTRIQQRLVEKGRVSEWLVEEGRVPEWLVEEGRVSERLVEEGVVSFSVSDRGGNAAGVCSLHFARSASR